MTPAYVPALQSPVTLGSTDLMQDYRLRRQSLEALLRILPSKNTQGWSRETGAHWEKIAALRQEAIITLKNHCKGGCRAASTSIMPGLAPS
ncbi:hypothetical protein JOQ06_002364 [Pogonophryne albipinna]|uniref:Uncharacterized protein n=1 Tax=Pogonophryne albipinna TaxID=1090488 RepID=A0AAD6B6J3_9TELE|nr:hypothetical protein JOQ06_002364 [Pogonophryne albipinna]